MPDDIVRFGGPERRPGREADESVESLFHAHYPRIVYTAFSLVGDWDLAEQLAQEACLPRWRRWRWISDPQAAPLYLQRTVVNLSRATIRRKVIERRAPRARSMERAGTPEPDPAPVFSCCAPAGAGIAAVDWWRPRSWPLSPSASRFLR